MWEYGSSVLYLFAKENVRAERTKVLGRCYVCPMFTPIFDLLNVFFIMQVQRF